MHTPDELVGLYRARGLKMTPQRQAVFSAVFANEDHPTAETVHRMVLQNLPTVSLRTVYSVLTELVEMGEILSHDMGTGSTRFDPNNSAHHHVVCDQCASISDVDLGPVESAIQNQLGSKFQIRSTEIVVRGRCPKCTAHNN